MLVRTVEQLCGSYCDSANLRQWQAELPGYGAEFWSAMADNSLAGMLVAEEYGGSGLAVLDAVLAFESLGNSLAVSPLLESSVISASMLQLAGTSAQRREWLPELAAGKRLLVPAWLEPEHSGALDSMHCVVEKQAGELVLTGSKLLVPYANSADAVLVMCRSAQGPTAVIVPTQDLAMSQQANHAEQSLWQLRFDELRLPLEAQLDVSAVSAAWKKTLLLTQVLAAAQAIGGASQVQQLAVNYASEREQFGQPIGAFQAIAHYLADRATEIEGARYQVYQAAWAMDQDLPVTQLAPMAKYQATEVFRKTSSTAVQVHGGMGFSEEADPQLYYRRAKHLQLMYGDPQLLEQMIADEVFAA